MGTIRPRELRFGPQMDSPLSSKYWPIAQGCGENAAFVRSNKERRDKWHSLKLLIVEDDVACLELMAEVFTSLKAEVRPVSDSQKAASLVNQEKFDGVFLDLEMPNLHGFDLARQIRQSSWNKSTPMVIVTGRDDRKTMQEAFAIGATFFLQKPVDRQRLSRLFRTVRGGLFESRRRHIRVPLQTAVTCQQGSRTVTRTRPHGSHPRLLLRRGLSPSEWAPGAFRSLFDGPPLCRRRTPGSIHRERAQPTCDFRGGPHSFVRRFERFSRCLRHRDSLRAG